MNKLLRKSMMILFCGVCIFGGNSVKATSGGGGGVGMSQTPYDIIEVTIPDNILFDTVGNYKIKLKFLNYALQKDKILLPGDVLGDGKIDYKDYLDIYEFVNRDPAAGYPNDFDKYLLTADINKDGLLDDKDVGYILKMALKIDSLPALKNFDTVELNQTVNSEGSHIENYNIRYKIINGDDSLYQSVKDYYTEASSAVGDISSHSKNELLFKKFQALEEKISKELISSNDMSTLDINVGSKKVDTIYLYVDYTLDINSSSAKFLKRNNSKIFEINTSEFDWNTYLNFLKEGVKEETVENPKTGVGIGIITLGIIIVSLLTTKKKNKINRI